jgi:hypothetical protein
LHRSTLAWELSEVQDRQVNKAAATLALAGAALWSVGLGCSAITKIRPAEPPQLAADEQVRAFSLPSTVGSNFDVAETTKSSAVALIFYRGFW